MRWFVVRLNLVAMVAVCTGAACRPGAGASEADASASTSDAAAAVDAASPLASAARARLAELCAKLEPVSAKSAEPTANEGELDEATASALVPRLRALLPTRLRGASPSLSGARRVHDGMLVRFTVPDTRAPDEGTGLSEFVAWVGNQGAARLVPANTDVGDFDGDGALEVLQTSCVKNPLFTQTCTYSVQFAGGVRSRVVTQLGNVVATLTQVGNRSVIALLPRDLDSHDPVGAEEIQVLRFQPGGTELVRGDELAAARQKGYAQRSCDLEPRAPEQWSDRLRALGAEPAELDSLLAGLPSAPSAPRVEEQPERANGNSVLRMFAPPTPPRCAAAAPEVEQGFRSARNRAIEARAQARFARIGNAVHFEFGCTQRDGTPVVVRWAFDTPDAPPGENTEAWLLPTRTEEPPQLIAATGSRQAGEHSRIFTLALGPLIDPAGDGTGTSTVLGFEHELGTLFTQPTAALWRNAQWHQIPHSFEQLSVVQLAGGVITLSTENNPAMTSDTYPWPPSLYRVDASGAWRKTSLPADWSAKTAKARAAFYAK